MTSPLSLELKVGNTSQAFAVFRDELTPALMRGLINKMTDLPPLKEDATMDDFKAYAALVQSSMSLARIVAANDRAAMIAAAMVTQSGIARPIISTDEES